MNDIHATHAVAKTSAQLIRGFENLSIGVKNQITFLLVESPAKSLIESQKGDFIRQPIEKYCIC